VIKLVADINLPFKNKLKISCIIYSGMAIGPAIGILGMRKFGGIIWKRLLEFRILVKPILPQKYRKKDSIPNIFS
jgi:hypothetical protein